MSEPITLEDLRLAVYDPPEHYSIYDSVVVPVLLDYLREVESEIRRAEPRPNTHLTYKGGTGRAWRIIAARRRALRMGYEYPPSGP